jgi:CBS domain containing-hemolysin-like protein
MLTEDNQDLILIALRDLAVYYEKTANNWLSSGFTDGYTHFMNKSTKAYDLLEEMRKEFKSERSKQNTQSLR